jgi:hypothetical protein
MAESATKVDSVSSYFGTTRIILHFNLSVGHYRKECAFGVCPLAHTGNLVIKWLHLQLKTWLYSFGVLRRLVTVTG